MVQLAQRYEMVTWYARGGWQDDELVVHIVKPNTTFLRANGELGVTSLCGQFLSHTDVALSIRSSLTLLHVRMRRRRVSRTCGSRLCQRCDTLRATIPHVWFPYGYHHKRLWRWYVKETYPLELHAAIELEVPG